MTSPNPSRRNLIIGAATVVAVGGALAFLPRRRRSTAGINLAFVPKALNNPVFEITRAGAEARVKELQQVAFRWIGPTTTDASAQSQIIDDLAVQGVNGICISCNDPAALVPAINRAVDAGVAVITWDSDAPKSRRLTTIGIDQEAAGRRAGELLLERLKAGKVAVLTGTPGALNLEKRQQGFLSAIAGNSSIQVVATDPCNDDIQRAVEIVEQRLNAIPDLAGYFFVGMWPFFADLRTLPRLRSFVSGGGICISLDALSGALHAVEQGFASALVGYSWYEFGRTAVDVLVNYIQKKEKPADPLNTPLFVVDPSNVAEFLKREHDTR